MLNDRLITISAAGNRWADSWPAQSLLVSDLYERLRNPTRGVETQKEYDRLPKKQQDNLKDVGGYVAGKLLNDTRKSNTVESREVLTLDVDNIPAGGTDDILRRVDGLSCGYCVYSTRKHRPAAPRLRVLIPLNRPVSAEEYEPIARMTSKLIDPSMRIFDPSTFQPSRLMYWPSVCSDGEYIFVPADKPFISAEGVLAMYTDWRNISAWPDVPGHQQEAHKRMAAKQGDPLTKKGVVGAFCRAHSIHDVLNDTLAGIYAPTASDDRWTYSAGTTSGGAIIYDDKFLYSHHATDPAGGRLCNAFDLCRLHLYGSLDDSAKDGTPVAKLPSYKAMTEAALNDKAVSDILNQERLSLITEDFGETESDGDKTNIEWARELVTTESGTYKKTIKNVYLVLKYHPALKGRIRLNTFANKPIGVAPLPWAGREEQCGEFEWRDEDSSGLRYYIEQLLGFRTEAIIEDALSLISVKNGFDPVAEYLRSLKWDGSQRLDTLYVDYLGAEDCEYTRAVTRKAFVAAVARTMDPGTKFDYMTVVQGPQGIGKSTLFARMGREWFTASIETFEKNKAAELIQGVLIAEIGELGAFNKSDTNAIKQFLSCTVDRYRAAYGRHVLNHPRRCVFFGTTNDTEYLKDLTGNRRFWPIDCDNTPKKSVFTDLTEDVIDQLWAEAYFYWQMGEPLILSKELEAIAELRREGHKETDDVRGIIEAFLEKPIPADWQKWDRSRRELFWSGNMRGDMELVPRDRVCVPEICRECLHDYRALIPRKDSFRIAAALASIPGWERKGTMRFGGGYGRQKGFVICHKAHIQAVHDVQAGRQVGEQKTQKAQKMSENTASIEFLKNFIAAELT